MKITIKLPKPRATAAKALGDSLFRSRVVPSKKVYTRKTKHKGRDDQ